MWRSTASGCSRSSRATKQSRKTTGPEAHRKYIDIQYLIEGEELIGVAPLDSMERVAEAAPERDIWFYEGETAKLPLGGGRFAILFRRTRTRRASPWASAEPVRKVVVKVAVEPAE